MLRAYILDFQDSWDKRLPLVEFAYNNNYQSSIQMAPSEALYGRSCRSLICWFVVDKHKLIRPKIVDDTSKMVQRIRNRMRIAQSRQKNYADQRRRDLEFLVGDHVYLKLAPTKGIMRFGKNSKLSPRFKDHLRSLS